MMRAAVLTLAFGLLVACLVVAAPNNRPIIGILSVGPQSTEDSCGTFAGAASAGCFTVYYTKYIESAGGRVVPIKYTASQQELDSLFASLNGILFTGGGLDLQPGMKYYETAQYLYNKVLEANDKGDYVPLHGTCQGFQLLNILTAQNTSVLTNNAFDSEDVSWPLDLTPAAASSRLFGPSAPQDIVQILATQNVTSNLHHDGVTPDTFNGNARLTAFYNVLSTNVDRKGKAFISTMEAKEYPIYGVQWHPERPLFQWTDGMGINHSADAIRAMQYMANFFVAEARKNSHAFPSQAAEQKALIYNYNPTYMGDNRAAYFFTT